MKRLFLGNFRLDLVHPYPRPRAGASPGIPAVFTRAFKIPESRSTQIEELIRHRRYDSVQIDATGEYSRPM
jgi:hypothetical protein